MQKMKILYIYDVDRWAIHNVGLLWLGGQRRQRVVFKKIEDVKKEEFGEYDFIWYGYAQLYLKVPCDLSKSIISVHDPYELFAPHLDWKTKIFPRTLNAYIWLNFFRGLSRRFKVLNLLRRAKNVVTTSDEMACLLRKNGISVNILKTTTTIPLVKRSQISFENFSVLSVANDHLRKNFPLLNKIQDFCNNTHISCNIKRGIGSLSKRDYISLLDKHAIYVCTSMQEGGPLPAMDAMARGQVVLSTPVGQIQEMINGRNGFICPNFNVFKRRIMDLEHNRALLKRMRLNSLSTIRKRSLKNIRASVSLFLNRINSQI